jgi:hypothetical protein
MEKQKDIDIAVPVVAEAKRKITALSCCSVISGQKWTHHSRQMDPRPKLLIWKI